MNKTFSQLTIATASLAFGLALINTNPTQAATITYDLQVSIDSGPLLNETYFGSFSFDDLTLTGVGDEFLPVTELEFNFLDIDYTVTDDSEVAFSEGEFLGLSFSTDASFSFVPGFFTADEAFFTYDVADVGAGAGDVTYSLRPSPSPKSTPEPTSIMGLLGLGTLAASSWHKSKQTQK